MKHRLTRIAALCLPLLAGACAQMPAAEVVRHKIPSSDFPIAQSVEVPAGKKLIFVSGAGASVTDKSAKPGSLAAYGDTKTQSASALASISDTLKGLNLGMKDVVKMTVFLVGDPAKDGNIDFAGFMAAYTQYYGGKEHPELPARSAVKVAGLANPGWLVEIEVIAVAPE